MHTNDINSVVNKLPFPSISLLCECACVSRADAFKTLSLICSNVQQFNVNRLVQQLNHIPDDSISQVTFIKNVLIKFTNKRDHNKKRNLITYCKWDDELDPS